MVITGKIVCNQKSTEKVRPGRRCGHAGVGWGGVQIMVIAGQSSKGYQKAPSWFCPVGVKGVGSLQVAVVGVLHRCLNVRMELLLQLRLIR